MKSSAAAEKATEDTRCPYFESLRRSPRRLSSRSYTSERVIGRPKKRSLYSEDVGGNFVTPPQEEEEEEEEEAPVTLIQGSEELSASPNREHVSEEPPIRKIEVESSRASTRLFDAFKYAEASGVVDGEDQSIAKKLKTENSNHSGESSSSNDTLHAVTPPSSPIKIEPLNGKEENEESYFDDTISDNENQSPRTNSFEAMWSGSLPFNIPRDPSSPTIPIHTLILGTHPSIKSLSLSQYYGHPMNAFWWIAGDCLGFRRGTAISSSTGRPFQFASTLRYPPKPQYLLSYPRQVEGMTSKGFAMWDVVRSCVRPGSLDQDIKGEVVNDIQGFCERHKTIRRVVFANGRRQCDLFQKHFRDWWESCGDLPCSQGKRKRGASEKGRLDGNIVLVPGENPESLAAFRKYAPRRKLLDHNGKEPDRSNPLGSSGKRIIEVVSAISVSPAAARYTYEQKRDHWEKYCYRPGLQDYEGSLQSDPVS